MKKWSRFIWWLATCWGRWRMWCTGQRPADNWLSWYATRLRYGNPPRLDDK